MENDYRVVLCGSMRQFGLMGTIASTLNDLGVITQLPAPYQDARYLPEEEYAKIKKELSRSHFQLIADKSTAAILVVNPNMDDSEYHIGANTIADIAIAFWTGKRIFLYTNLPESLKSELCAWDAVALSEKLDVLVEYMGSKL
jgi:hypothetical protein